MKRTKRLTLECPAACHQITKAVAAAKGLTIQEMIYHVVRRYIFEEAANDPVIYGIKERLLTNAPLDDCPSDICTLEQKEEVIKATTHKLPWE